MSNLSEHYNKQFILTEEAVERYGKAWRGVLFKVAYAANKYMSADEFFRLAVFRLAVTDGYHPGYNEGVAPAVLYELYYEDGWAEEMIKRPFPVAVYEFELEEIL